jgi:hypothetical protein
MGAIHSLLDFGWKKCVQPPWDLITIPLFWQSMMFWDTLACFLGMPCTPNTPSRRVKRSVARHKRSKNCNMPSLFFGRVGWMVLLGSMLIPTAAFQGPAHPFSTVMMQLKGEYTRIQRLDEAVEFSPSTFVQYQSLEAKKLWKEFTTEDKKNVLEGHGCSLKIDKSVFFQRVQNLPVYREEFFYCLEKCESKNYDDCARRDLLDLDGSYRARAVVECCGTSTSQNSTSGLTESPSTETTVLESNLGRSKLALSELIGNTIICPVVNNEMSQWIMIVIFSTRASLAITPEISDFVSPPKPLARPVKLRGMANGIEIKGIGIVDWTFTTKDGTEVQIRTESYYVP